MPIVGFKGGSWAGLSGEIQKSLALSWKFLYGSRLANQQAILHRPNVGAPGGY